ISSLVPGPWSLIGRRLHSGAAAQGRQSQDLGIVSQRPLGGLRGLTLGVVFIAGLMLGASPSPKTASQRRNVGADSAETVNLQTNPVRRCQDLKRWCARKAFLTCPLGRIVSLPLGHPLFKV